MGEYAEMAFDRDFSQHVDEMMGYGCDDYEPYPYVVRSSSSRRSKPKEEIGLPYEDREIGKPILLRQFYKDLDTLKLNIVCLVIKQTEKAVLFKVDRKYEEDLKRDVSFWLPKSVLYRKENELSVIYAKYWATINDADELAELC